MRVGITGHQSLADPRGWDWARAEMHGLLAQIPEPLIGITSLAAGADSIFAEVVLQHKGLIEAVLPFPEYELKFHADDKDRYRQLLEKSSRVLILKKKHSDEESYFEAGKTVVNHAELLLAVWDGQPARGLGGTGDVVGYAMQKRKPLIHLDPIKRLVTNSETLSHLRREI